MHSRTRPLLQLRPSLSFALMLALLAVLWVAGGASRADTLGQVIVRGAAWLSLIVVALAGDRPVWGNVRPVVLFLLIALLLVLLQLVPLPPAVWQALPGRDGFLGATLPGETPPWRPLALVPGAAWNAAASLVVPIAMLVLVAGSSERELSRMPAVLLGMVALQAVIGLLQFSGAGFSNPFVNDTPGQVSGTFANRNHFALFLAIGCVLAPVWAFGDGRRPHWRGPVAIGLILLFALTILASGSRAGMALGMLALCLGTWLSFRPLRRELRHYPRWVMPVSIVTVVTMIVGLILLSVAADRAASITRIITSEGGEDLRTRALPTILAMIKTYFPAGSGFGGFEPLFRVQEPNQLLKLTYFNHAHNDFLETVLSGGIPGLLLLMAAVTWWGVASIRAWRVPDGAIYSRLGSALLLLVFAASVVDYPARTPMVMALIVVSAAWLSSGGKLSSRSALPRDSQQL